MLIIFYFPLLNFLNLNFGNSSGTGSKPPRLRGWQREIRFIPSHPPRSAPNRFIASREYSEQVG